MRTDANDAESSADDATLLLSPPNFADVPYGTRLAKRKPYNIVRS